jgi:thiamine-phosphate pyrophosphorylase
VLRPISDCRLYTFVDTAYLHGRDAREVARQLCEGGSDIIQLRAKDKSAEEIRRIAEQVVSITNAANVPLVINDHPQIAAEVGAAVCHLGQEDFFEAGYKCVADLPYQEIQYGLSTHAPDQAARAVAAEPAYVAIGPIYATATKPTAKPVALSYVQWAAENVKIPWFAIGGINERTIDAVLEAGARRICIVSAILNSADPVRACREFKKRVDSATH